MKMNKFVKSQEVDRELMREILERFEVPYLVVGNVASHKSEVEKAKIIFLKEMAIIIEKAGEKND